MPETTSSGFWSRATLALAFAVYGWTMLGVELYLHYAPLPEGPDRGLALFRRLVMGRAVLALGGAALLAAVVLAILAVGRARHRLATIVALALSAAWLATLAAIWPV